MNGSDQKAALNRKRLAAARFSLASAVTLASAKLVVGVATGSLGVLASAFDNFADILMSGVNYLSIRKSMEPADTTHPYGHGKIETLGTVFEAAVIILTGAWIIQEGIRRLQAGVVPRSVGSGILVMLVSVGASWYIARRIHRAGEETGSAALRADALHFRTDVYSGGGIVLSLLLYRATGWKWVDPGVALVVGVYILGAAYSLVKEAAHDLLDRGLPPETVDRVRQIIDGHRPLIVDFHDLRTRRAGSEMHVDFHVVVCRHFRLEDAHRVADHIETEVALTLGNAHVVTHIDPCDTECPGKDECSRVLEAIRRLDAADGREPTAAGDG